MSGYIDNYARPENPVVDVTGKPLGVLMTFTDKGAASPTDHPLLSVPGLPSIPPSLVTLPDHAAEPDVRFGLGADAGA